MSRLQSMDSVEFRMNTSSPRGRNSRAASGIQRSGSHQIDAPYSETARSNEASGSGTASALASISSSPRAHSSSSRRAVSSCAGELPIDANVIGLVRERAGGTHAPQTIRRS